MNLDLNRSARLSTGALLLLTSLAKIYSVVNPNQVLGLKDPILMVPETVLFLGVAAAELGVVYCAFTRPQLFEWSMALLVSGMASYRLVYWYVYPRKPCPCLGSLGDIFHVSESVVEAVTSGLFWYLAFVTSFAIASKVLVSKHQTRQLHIKHNSAGGTSRAL